MFAHRHQKWQHDRNKVDGTQAARVIRSNRPWLVDHGNHGGPALGSRCHILPNHQEVWDLRRSDGVVRPIEALLAPLLVALGSTAVAYVSWFHNYCTELLVARL